MCTAPYFKRYPHYFKIESVCGGVVTASDFKSKDREFEFQCRDFTLFFVSKRLQKVE